MIEYGQCKFCGKMYEKRKYEDFKVCNMCYLQLKIKEKAMFGELKK